MDSSLYKTLRVSRGLNYNYFASPAQSGKPTILFLHGYPVTAQDWDRIIPHFKDRGYGIIAPDLLGHGDTDKPTDPALYVSSVMCRDFVDILDAEGVKTVIAIGHDWGAKAVSRLANWCPERVSAYAFFSLPYMPPRTDNFEAMLDELRKATASDVFGYWYFFSADDVDEVMQSHLDTAVSITYPHDPEVWKTRVAPIGALRASLLEDYKAPLASYMSKEEAEDWKRIMRKNGFTAPTCWYKIMVNGMQFEDDRLIPLERHFPPKTSPVFFGACKYDYVCLPEVGCAVMQSEGFKDHDVTIRFYDADHWVTRSRAVEVCKELEEWMECTLSKSLTAY